MDQNFKCLYLRGLKAFFIAVPFFVFLSSCHLNLILSEEVALKNRKSLSGLKVGMTKDEVVNVMGVETIKTINRTEINSPYRVETLKDDSGNSLELLFYYTDENSDPLKISDDELTPVVLKDGKVEGWGRTYLADIAKGYRYQMLYKK